MYIVAKQITIICYSFLIQQISIGYINSTVFSPICKKHACMSHQRQSKLHESEGRVQSEVFEKLGSVRFSKLHKKHTYSIT